MRLGEREERERERREERGERREERRERRQTVWMGWKYRQKVRDERMSKKSERQGEIQKRGKEVERMRGGERQGWGESKSTKNVFKTLYKQENTAI